MLSESEPRTCWPFILTEEVQDERTEFTFSEHPILTFSGHRVLHSVLDSVLGSVLAACMHT